MTESTLPPDGGAQRLLEAMIADGVDVRSEDDVQRWIDEFNQRPAADRAAVVVGEELAAALVADDDGDETEPLPPIRPVAMAERAKQAREHALFRRVAGGPQGETAGPTPTGPTPTGPTPTDPAPTGPPIDAGSSDAGSSESGPSDAGSSDAGSGESGPSESASGEAEPGSRTETVPGGDQAGPPGADAFAWHVVSHRGGGPVAEDDEACVALWAEVLGCLLSCPEAEGPGEWGEHIGVVLPGVLTLLYAAQEPLPWDVVLHAAREQYLVVGDPFFGADGEEETDPDDVGGAVFADALRFRVRLLVDWGVIEESSLGLTLSGLAEAAWMIEMRQAGLVAPAIGDLAEAPASELLEDAAGYPEDMFVEEAEGWLALRDPGQAAHEVLEAGAAGDPSTRQVAYGVLSLLGPEATAGVFAGLDLPAVRPYVFVWCGEKGVDCDEVPTADELGWLLIDSGAAAVRAGEPEQAAAQLDGIYDQDQAGYLEGLWRLEHPNTPEVLEAIGAHHPIPHVAKAARKAALRSRSLRAGRQA